MHKARNVIRVDIARNTKLVIKSYRQIYLFNQFVYANVLPSKAKRAFHYAGKLISKGFRTPEPVAYIECVDNGRMTDSYFICTYTDYQPLKTILELPQDEARRVIDQLATYTASLHQQHIYHKDFSIGNILFKYNGHEYTFSLVDNNRMNFRQGSFADRMKNLRRLDLPLPMLAYYGQQYAKATGENELFTLTAMLNYRKKRMLFRYWKGQLKHFLLRFLTIHRPVLRLEQKKAG